MSQFAEDITWAADVLLRERGDDETYDRLLSYVNHEATIEKLRAELLTAQTARTRTNDFYEDKFRQIQQIIAPE